MVKTVNISSREHYSSKCVTFYSNLCAWKLKFDCCIEGCFKDLSSDCLCVDLCCYCTNFILFQSVYGELWHLAWIHSAKTLFKWDHKGVIGYYQPSTLCILFEQLKVKIIAIKYFSTKPFLITYLTWIFIIRTATFYIFNLLGSFFPSLANFPFDKYSQMLIMISISVCFILN